MSKKKEEKTNNKKALIIITVVIGAILVIGLGSFFGYKYYQRNSSVGTDWGDTYFEYIKDAKTNKDIKIENNSTLEFIDVPEIEEPVMVSSYQKDNKNYTNIYYINNDEVKNKIDLEPSTVEMLYSIEEKKYNWYVHKTTDQEEKYTPLSKVIDEKKETSKEYTYTPNEEITQDTIDGNKLSITKFDTLFIKPEIEIESIEYKEEIEEKDLKESLTNTVKDFKTIKKIEKEVKEEVVKKEEETIKKQEEITKAAEEVKKKAEEEAAKAAEEAKKGFKVGKYRVKYGTYRGEFFGDSVDSKLIFRSDGTAEINLGKGPLAATYKIGSRNYSQTEIPDYRECIIFTTSDGEYDYVPVSETTLSDGGIFSFIYVGE